MEPIIDLEFDGKMAMPELIWEIFYRAVLLYAIDYAMDGKLDLYHRKVEWEELKIVKWAHKLWRKIR